ncbi:ribbon-helix-helix domain-containing protein [Aquibium oceanicum]|uniref:Type II toxin-antitoxin system ParD family antitoxin n=1 Tax=Aquibium oceanicum TaxID=1670800 RepID=A0A1L3STY3_9HYPH|nr:type II toxin-antitoxin system ParD family antitoxin [Aquibium oceanicum]APH72821.1 hypothetical protein BSQ44_16695 [Aquibium oceanicum]
MNKIDRVTIDLPAEQTAFIERLVESGEFDSASEVIKAGIEALQLHDREIEHWLRTEVADTFDRMQADPSRGIPLEDVIARFEKRASKRQG